MPLNASESPIRMTAQVSGYVQGVGYRMFAQHSARILGLAGFAQNQADGSVLVVAEGSRALLERLLAELRQGPYGAEVAELHVNWTVATGEFSRFSIR